MSTLIVGDVHGCAIELQALVDKTKAKRVILVGDLFTKGPDPAGVWSLIRDRGFESVLGNHDARVLAVHGGQRQGDAHGQAVVDALVSGDPQSLVWLAELPLFLRVGVGARKYTVVHAGMHPTGRRKLTETRVALSVRRWPIDEPEAPRWWRVYEGKRGVIFGHDARQGLVLRRRPGGRDLIGLDTGCVYGGALTGVLLEDDQLVSEPARKAWQPVTG